MKTTFVLFNHNQLSILCDPELSCMYPCNFNALLLDVPQWYVYLITFLHMLMSLDRGLFSPLTNQFTIFNFQN